MLNVINLEARDIPEAWFLGLRAILLKGYQYKIDNGSFAGQQRKELDFLQIHIKQPGTLPLIPFVPEGIPAPTNGQAVDDYMRYLLTSEKHENEQYTYGQHIEKQIFPILKKLKAFGFNSNQACINIGNAESVNLDDPECLRLLDIRVRYGAVHLFAYYRSWDWYGGFPQNIAGIEKVKQFIADDLGVQNGELIIASKGAHLYDYSWEWARIASGLVQ